MPRRVLPLTDTQIRKIKPGANVLRLSDGDGLYLLVQPSGGKWWRFDYIHRGRRKTVSFGTYPEVSLVAARARRAAAREHVAAGIDPSRERQEAREAAVQGLTWAGPHPRGLSPTGYSTYWTSWSRSRS